MLQLVFDILLELRFHPIKSWICPNNLKPNLKYAIELKSRLHFKRKSQLNLGTKSQRKSLLNFERKSQLKSLLNINREFHLHSLLKVDLRSHLNTQVNIEFKS